MTEDEPLFEIDGAHFFTRGEAVVVQTIWGDERGIISRAVPDSYYYALFEVALERGDTITIAPNRLRRIS